MAPNAIYLQIYLPSKQHFFEFPMVSSLIDYDTRWWRVDLIRVDFLPFEAKTIQKLFLSYNLPGNKIIWIGNKKCEFSVKSAYHIAHNLIEAKKEGECSSGDFNIQL